MITDEFRQQVLELREQGKSWPEVSRALGRPKRTCQRAGAPQIRLCKHRGCEQVALASGLYCTEHAKARMHNNPGQGDRQQQVMRLLRKHGHLTSEQLRQMTGIGSSSLGQITGRLARLGLIERPLMGHFTMPRPENLKPEHPIERSPDRY